MEEKRKLIWGWALYDWANSAFATTVMAGFFPLFFKLWWSHGSSANVSTAQLGVANALASLMVAICAPFLGAIADSCSKRKFFLMFFAYMGVLATGSLFAVAKGQWELAILAYCIGLIGFSGANIFYDSLIIAVADESEVDYVSGLGFGLGYLGGGLLFLINVIMTRNPDLFGIPSQEYAVRLSFLTVALWWGGFTLFTLFWVPEPTKSEKSDVFAIIKEGFRKVIIVLSRIRELKTVALFLLAYWFYIDGVDTIIRMAVDYGLALGFNSKDLILALLLVQFIGFPAAIAFGKLGAWWGPKKAILLAITFYIFITAWAATISKEVEFFTLAVLIALVQGGVQALSRSYFSRLIPKSHSGQFFGFYNMLGKSAAILGPLLVAGVGLWARSILDNYYEIGEVGAAEILASRIGVSSIIILFIIGGTLLYFVDENKAKDEIKALGYSD